jgi:hypothetical protein
MAKAGMLRGIGKPAAVRSAAKPPPSVAPMNKEGEKMPPDEPDPRLVDVASALQTNSSASNPTS